MKAIGRGLIITLVLAFAAGIAGAFLGASLIAGQQHPASLHDVVHRELSLTPEQEERLAVLEQQFAVQRASREAELRAANAELAAAIQSQHEYSADVQAAVEHFHHVMGELQKETIEHVLAMRGVLTPEQAVTFDQQISEALTDEAS